MPRAAPRILVVEDNLLVAMDEQAMVEQCGGIVIGPVGSVGEALEIIGRVALDGAVLDVNLGGSRIWPVTDVLERMGVPFILATGYEKDEISEHLRHGPILMKPVICSGLDEALRGIGLIA